jgi:hypothetical protein
MRKRRQRAKSAKRDMTMMTTVSWLLPSALLPCAALSARKLPHYVIISQAKHLHWSLKTTTLLKKFQRKYPTKWKRPKRTLTWPL